MPDVDTLEKLAGFIDTHRYQIVENLDPESIDVYVFLSRRFSGGGTSKDRLFQFVFRSFYRMDSAGLTDEFKAEYFRVLHSLRGTGIVDLAALVRSFYKFPTRKGQHSLQFSFVTKLAHTINVSYPIYDGEVANTLGFNRPAPGELQPRIDKFMAFYEWLKSTYATILADRLLGQIMRDFRVRFEEQASYLADVKILDFIFWSTGKLIGDGKLPGAPNHVFRPPRMTRTSC